MSCPLLAAELELEESSTSSPSSTSEDEISDQEMDFDVEETALNGEMQPFPALTETNTQALVPVLSTRPTFSSDTSAVSVYRNVPRVASVSHPHFRVVPALATAGQTGMVVAGVVPPPSASQLPSSAVRAITAGNEVAKYNSQVSIDSNTSDGADATTSIQYESAGDTITHERIFIRESILSLLLRLHSRFIGHSDSYRISENGIHGAAEVDPRTSTSADVEEDSRIGDGSFWIGKVLDKLCRLDPRVKQTIETTRAALWPPRTMEDDPLGEANNEAKEREKKRKIKERQQRLLQEFATKQKQFMQQAMAAEDMDTDPETTSADPVSTMNAAAPGTSTNFPSAQSTLLNRSSATEVEKPTMSQADPSVPEEIAYEEYDCVICNQASPSTSERPMCLVVLLQATSVLAHKSQHQHGESLAMPVSEEDRFSLQGVETLAKEMERRVGYMRQCFDETSWLSSLNIGYEGGVYVHTCGHYLHLDCHKQYLQSLRSQQRQQSLNVERGEYSCPLCRQLANSALPIATQLYGKKTALQSSTLQSPPGGLVLDHEHGASDEILRMFIAEPPISLHVGSNLMEAMGRVMEDMTNATYPRFRQITPTPSPASLFLFVQSIARTNLEIELLQRGNSLGRGTASSSTVIRSTSTHLNSSSSNAFASGSNTSSGRMVSASSPTPGTSSANWNSPGLELRFSSSPTPSGSSAGSGASSHSTSPWSLLPKRSCLLPLLHVLATHSKILTTRPYRQLWSQVTGYDWSNTGHVDYDSSDRATSVGRCEKDVPLLIQDVSSLLIQMVLILPLPLERRHFACLVQRLFNLLVVQIMAQQTVALGEVKRNLYKSSSPSDWSLVTLMACVLHHLDGSPLYMGEESHPESQGVDVEADIQRPLRQMAVHFLRLASLLRLHLFGDILPVCGSSPVDREEFTELCSFLNISCEPKFDACVNPRTVIGRWCNELLLFVAGNHSIGRRLLRQPTALKGPRLLTLPYSYDTLFQVYPVIFFFPNQQFVNHSCSLLSFTITNLVRNATRCPRSQASV